MSNEERARLQLATRLASKRWLIAEVAADTCQRAEALLRQAAEKPSLEAVDSATDALQAILRVLEQARVEIGGEPAEGAADRKSRPRDREWLSCDELAGDLGLSANRVREYCKAGHRKTEGYPTSGPFIVAAKFGSVWRIHRDELAAFLDRAGGRCI